MDAKKETEGNNKEKTTGNIGTGDQPSTNSFVEQLDAKIERLAAETEKAEVVKRELADLMARQALGGRSLAPLQPEKPKEDTPTEFKNRFMKGEIENPFR